MISRWIMTFAILVTLSVLVDPAAAQVVRGRIEGTIKDQQGQLIANAKLTIVNLGTGETLPAVSSGEGVFVAVEVKPGSYRVTAEAPGFKKTTVEGIVVQVATVNFDNPVTDINSTNFGRISSIAGRPRLMQYALRLNF